MSDKRTGTAAEGAALTACCTVRSRSCCVAHAFSFAPNKLAKDYTQTHKSTSLKSNCRPDCPEAADRAASRRHADVAARSPISAGGLLCLSVHLCAPHAPSSPYLLPNNLPLGLGTCSTQLFSGRSPASLHCSPVCWCTSAVKRIAVPERYALRTFLYVTTRHLGNLMTWTSVYSAFREPCLLDTGQRCSRWYSTGLHQCSTGQQAPNEGSSKLQTSTLRLST